MSATDAMIARLRRMTAEPTLETYVREDMADAIERYPVNDSDGNKSSESDWAATYDLHRAAADIWTEKVAGLNCSVDQTIPGSGSVQSSQAWDHALAMARYHKSRSRAEVVTMTMQPPASDSNEWVANLAEESD